MILALCALGGVLCLAPLIIAVCRMIQLRKERRMAVAYIGEGVPFDPEPYELVPIEKYWD